MLCGISTLKKIWWLLLSSENSITRDAAHLAAVEMAIGTAAHAAHLPFVGHFLSLNEGAFLCHGSLYSESRGKAALACYEISGVAATMKSLAPAAKKLGPMLSIIMQGMLFSLGLLLLGKRRLGQIFAFMLLSAWAFIQPFITISLSLGIHEFHEIWKFYQYRLRGEYMITGYAILTVVLALYFLKLISAIGIVFLVNRRDEAKWEAWQKKWTDRSKKILKKKKGAGIGGQSAWRGALRDLLNPFFLLSFALTWVFLFVQAAPLSTLIWQALRPVAIAFLILYLMRSPEFLALCHWLAKRIGLLRPIERRLRKVHAYWDEQDKT